MTMAFRDDFNLFVGAKYGIFKGVKATEQAVVGKSIQSLNHLSKGTDITALAWSSTDEEEILIGLSNQLVKIYDTNAKVFTLSLDAKMSSGQKSEGNICGLLRYDGIVVTATESGHVRLLKYEDDDGLNIYAGGPISKMRHSKYSPNIIGTGGLENELKLWDLSTGKNTFTAKNVPNDSLQLRVKVWVTDHVFMPSSGTVVVGSKYGYVRMYDPRAQRKPVVKVDLPDKSVTCITSSSQEQTVLCGLAKGDIIAVDMRKGQTSKNYKGFVGAVKDIVCHPTEPYIVSVGLDRFLRVHDVNSKKLLVKEYMVSRMNCLLMRSNFSLKSSDSEPVRKGKKRGPSKELLSDGTSDNEEAQQFDEMFKSMEEVMDGAKQKKQTGALHSARETSETPSKKKKSLLLLNPFASKSTDATPVKVSVATKTSPKKKSTASKKQIEEDSDDDIMIVSETVSNTMTSNDDNAESEGSEVDEAEGESDDFDDSSDDQECSEEEIARTKSTLHKVNNGS